MTILPFFTQFDAEFRRFSLRRSELTSFEDFYKIIEHFHKLFNIEFNIYYSDPIHYDLLPINNDDNFQKALSSAKPLLRLHIQRKGKQSPAIRRFAHWRIIRSITIMMLTNLVSFIFCEQVNHGRILMDTLSTAKVQIFSGFICLCPYPPPHLHPKIVWRSERRKTLDKLPQLLTSTLFRRLAEECDLSNTDRTSPLDFTFEMAHPFESLPRAWKKFLVYLFQD